MVRRPAILVTFGALALAGFAACTDHGAAKLTQIKDRVCACASVACAEQALQDVPSQRVESNHRTQAIARGMMDCLAKLQEAERPVTDPDAEGNAGAGDTGVGADPAPAHAPSAAPSGPPPPTLNPPTR